MTDMTATTTLTPDSLKYSDCAPYPLRFWWLKRIVIGSIAGLVFLVALRVWWGWDANRRLDAEVANYRALGQPVYAEDFDAEAAAVPDEQNAVVLYEKAMNQLVGTTRGGVAVDAFDEDGSIESDLASAKELYKANLQVFAIARQARSLSQVAWPYSLKNRWSGIGAGPSTSIQRQLARLLRFAALMRDRDGENVEAVETVHDLLSFSDAILADPTLISTLVGMGCTSMSLNVIEHQTQLFDVSRGELKNSSVELVASIRALITTLENEQSVRDRYARAALGERATYLDEMPKWTLFEVPSYSRFGLPLGTSLDKVCTFALRPMLTQDLLRRMSIHAAAAEASREELYVAMLEHFGNFQEAGGLIGGLARPALMANAWGSNELGSTLRVFEIFHSSLVKRRMAATTLAIRLFEADHGRRPDKLDELVPDYLTAVPRDPFAEDGATISYKPNAEWPLLYSYGIDGDDDGGSKRRWVGGESRTWDGDILFYLSGRPPRK